LKVEEVQRDIHKMLSSQNCSNKKSTYQVLPDRNVQSDQIGKLSKEADVNKSVPDLRNDSEIRTSKNPQQTHVINSLCNQLPHLQEQCFVATDTETQSINEIDVEYIKVEADPLQIENDDTGSVEDSVHVCSDRVKCESPTNKLLYRLLTSDKRCNFSTHTRTVSTPYDTPGQTLQQRNNEKVADKTLIPIDNFRSKCNESSVANEGESDLEEIQDSASAQFQGDIKNTAASSEPGCQRYHSVFMWNSTLYKIFCFVLQFCVHLFAYALQTQYFDVTVFQVHNHYNGKLYNFLYPFHCCEQKTHYRMKFISGQFLNHHFIAAFHLVASNHADMTEYNLIAKAVFWRWHLIIVVCRQLQHCSL
jgi:hypothetical protein